MWRCSVPEAQAKCNSRQFAEWQAYYEINPWGEERADLRAGIIASTIANVNRESKRKAFVPRDFMPDFDSKPKPAQSQQEMAAVMGQLMAKQNAYVARTDR